MNYSLLPPSLPPTAPCCKTAAMIRQLPATQRPQTDMAALSVRWMSASCTSGPSRCTSACSCSAFICDTQALQLTYYITSLCLFLTRSFSFSSPLMFDLRASVDNTLALRIAVRSLGACRRMPAAITLRGGPAAADWHDGVCRAPQTPEHARQCVAAVSAVAFEVSIAAACHCSLPS